MGDKHANGGRRLGETGLPTAAQTDLGTLDLQLSQGAVASSRAGAPAEEVRGLEYIWENSNALRLCVKATLDVPDWLQTGAVNAVDRSKL